MQFSRDQQSKAPDAGNAAAEAMGRQATGIMGTADTMARTSQVGASLCSAAREQKGTGRPA